MTPQELLKSLNDARAAHLTWIADNKNPDGILKSDSTQEFRNREEAIGKQLSEYQTAKQVADAEERARDGIAAAKAPEARMIRGGEDLVLGEQIIPQKSMGEMFVESPEFKGRPRGAGAVSGVHSVEVDELYGKGRGFKTLFDTGTSYTLQNVRLPAPITPGAQQPTVASLMPEGRTSGNAILYMEETTTTSNAAETAESGTKPEAALVFTERTSPVRKIAVTLPVTDESLDDIPFIESYIDTRLRFFIQVREDSELILGDGNSPNLTGILTTSGINTQAAGADSNADALFKGIIKVQTQSFFDADAVVLHPSNWQTMRLSKDDVGQYLFGPPSQTGPKQVFGYTLVTTTAITANTGLVGAFQACAEVFRRTDLSLQVGWINDQFTKNQRTILVEERLALVVFRPKGFTKVTGLS